MSDSKSKTNWYWPKITDAQSAKDAAKSGFWASIIVAFITAIFATISLISRQDVASINAWAYLDAVLFAFLAWRIKMMSRLFSVIAIILFVAEKVMMAQTQGAKGLPLAIILLLLFINGARGTFAYHKFDKFKDAA